MMRAPLFALALGAAATTACDAQDTLVTPDPHLERMLRQKRADPYKTSEFFADGKTMQKPPDGTVAYDDTTGHHDVVEGIVDGAYVAKIPVAVTRDALEEGRRDYDVFCGPCHGALGDGRGPVALNFRLRKPPSLVDAPVTQYPPGQIYAVIAVGYGLMPSYATQLGVEERWRVVMYVEALQVAHRANVADLPPAVRAELEKEAEP